MSHITTLLVRRKERSFTERADSPKYILQGRQSRTDGDWEDTGNQVVVQQQRSVHGDNAKQATVPLKNHRIVIN